QRIAHENIVVDLSDVNDFKAIEASILEFLNQLESPNKSLVWVSATADFTDIDETIVLVPTLQEAQDLIEMDEVSRDLGF
ncbi:MAG: ribonuclease Z, partial [Flavobacteriaceae bacterium]|nr:ribonuclease Z [Flavobacteriaceae bacterium]